ncbi:MAG: putative CoA-substrate-specific enzyme activase [Hydrocarboniphaga sp.]|uniref:acyl-CoA dehydratase activase n=1 Tax=Hydrocarboniphaga sp. TaxID=2033016 RepID=UPI00262CC73E|nr:acyl-CoA dehydratase activase [Hydrocarboniphaga sp.]MDB5971667.1 putative CoA-substrate-specific enzyme activase [Hydrocarboniphaga sp.]
MSQYFMGVDLGSTTAKTVILDGGGSVVAARIVQMGAVSREGLRRSVEGALEAAGLSMPDIAYTIGTGYGRRLVPGVGRTFTEITCHARGVSAICPGVRLVIDIGGQDSKVIAVDDRGLVDDFAMNDRCASGTGRFYEVLARALECEMSQIGDLAMKGTRDLEVSSLCATFAETEIISLLAEGASREDIAASVHRAVAHRVLGLVALVGVREPIVMTGGVANNRAAVHFLAKALDRPLQVPPDPQITGALGAALLALDTTGARATQGDLSMLEKVEREVESAFVPANRFMPTCATCSGDLDDEKNGSLRGMPIRSSGRASLGLTKPG